LRLTLERCVVHPFLGEFPYNSNRTGLPEGAGPRHLSKLAEKRVQRKRDPIGNCPGRRSREVEQARGVLDLRSPLGGLRDSEGFLRVIVLRRIDFGKVR